MNSTNRGRVLIVDDDECIGSLLTDLLTEDGYDAIYTKNVPTALCEIRRTKPDCVISDLMIAGAIGFIRGCQQERIPVAIMTGFHEAENFFPEQCPPVLLKPFHHTELGELLEGLLSNTHLV